MNLQNILFPKIGICTERRLYMRLKRGARYDELRERVLFEKYASAQFNTYFNGFSIEKWRKYTVLDNLELHLRLQGSFCVYLLRGEKLHDSVMEETLAVFDFSSEEPEEAVYRFHSNEPKGIYAFRLVAAKADSVFYGGFYGTEVEAAALRDVTLGVDICTFRREPFVERNIGILRDNILDNPECDLSGHIHIYISDNGKTLEIPRLAGDRIHIFPNKNAGGTGGFTRGMIEALRRRREHGVTHLLLMDDDVIIEPEAIVKTYHFLRMVKEEYSDAFIGGAMLRLDRRAVQVEAGAVWNAGRLLSLKSGLDLKYEHTCLYNETLEHADYNAWWYCCMPIDVVTEQNLPLPLFIRGDDVEYGLRNRRRVIFLNGICVWHETFENKYSSFLDYYIVRNQLIDNALHVSGYSWGQFTKYLVGRVARQAMYYRYKNIGLMLRAAEDFMRGVDWLKAQDGELLHKEIMAAGYRPVPVEEIEIPFNYPAFDQSLVHEREGKWHRILRLLSFNGMILKAKGDSVASMAMARPVNFYRAKRVLNYDAGAQKGFVTEKNWRELRRCCGRLLRLLLTGKRRYEAAQKDYLARYRELTSLEFWEEYLGTDEKSK